MFYRLDAEAANRGAALADKTNQNAKWANLRSTLIFERLHLLTHGHSVFFSAQFA